MSDLNASTNRLTVEKLQTPEGQAKFAQLGGQYIKDKLRETSFFDQILPPTPVDENELVPGVSEGSTTAVPGVASNNQEDTVMVIRDIQIGGSAMRIDFRGQPTAKFFNGKRFAIPFGTVSTLTYEKTQQELLANKYDILKVLEDTAYLETHTERDRKFLEYCGLAVAQTSQALAVDGPLQRNAFRILQHPALKNQLEPKVVLLSKVAFTDLGLWDSIDLGDRAAEVTENGYVLVKIAGMKFVVSLKSELFDTFSGQDISQTVIWSFPDPDFLGYNHYLSEYSVWNHWEANLFRFRGWQDIGAGFGNINGVTKLTVSY